MGEVAATIFCPLLNGGDDGGVMRSEGDVACMRGDDGIVSREGGDLSEV